MIQYEIGDLLSAKTQLIAHQVNCMGVMGSGVARQVRIAFPSVYKSYADMCAANKPADLLGRVQFIHVLKSAEDRFFVVANMFAQRNYGKDGKRYTDYAAFSECLQKLRAFMSEGGHRSIAFPYRIGCGLGGGDWDGIILPMIRSELREFDVVIRKLP